MSRKTRRSGTRSPKAREAANGGTGGSRPVAPHRPAPINAPLLGLSLVGAALAGYLTYTGWSGASAAFCEAGSDCDIVQSSRWGSFLGVPTALWGLLTYALLAAIAWRARPPAVQWQRATLVAAAGWVVSVYLTAISVLVLDATCPYCLASLAVFTGILGLLTWQRTAAGDVPWKAPLVSAALAAVAIAGVMHTSSSRTIVAGEGEDPYLMWLAVELSDRGAAFYGASWCPHCQEQKALFGASADRLPYVECSPGGRQAPPSRSCTAAGIGQYPTWVFPDGERVVQVLSPEELAERVGYTGPPADSAGG